MVPFSLFALFPRGSTFTLRVAKIMAEEDEEKTEVVPEPTEDTKKTRKNGGHTIPAQMM